MILRHCIVCGTPTQGSRCARHTPRQTHWRNHKGKMAPDWPKIRARVKAQEPTCRRCGAPTTAIDHIIPRAEGGTDERSNLQGLCSRCHRFKTQAEAKRGTVRAHARR